MQTDAAIRPITVDEFHRMGALGILGPDERVELLDGQILALGPLGFGHVTIHTRVVTTLVNLLGQDAVVAGQGVVVLDGWSEPQPDVCIFEPTMLTAPKSRWLALTIALIEISESSLRFDSGRKLRAYARAGVPEYLIIDVAAKRVIRHRNPAGDSYAQVDQLRPGEAFTLTRLPAHSIPVMAFFGSQ